MVTDVSTIPGAVLNSNHFLSKVTLKVRAANHKRQPKARRPIRRPEAEQKSDFNDAFKFPLPQATPESSGQSNPAGTETKLDPTQPNPQQDIDSLQDRFQDAVLKAMEHSTPTQGQRPKHFWIFNQTWQLIEQCSEARKKQDTSLCPVLSQRHSAS